MTVRQAQLEGVPHWVVPVTMLTVDAHHGSDGVLFYGAEEIRRSVPLWNGRPVVVYHPRASASDPNVFSAQKVGTIFNAAFDGRRLTAEAWINADRAATVDPRIAQAIAARRTLEVSTGLALDAVARAGEWGGKSYRAIATNFMPDHLALLPDQVGACSVAAGCGMLRSDPSLSFA